jgi:ubiquinone/menaquinone biosynthesis C-methylase UbiE
MNAPDVEVEDGYAERYERSHEDIGARYHVAYREYHLIDRMFDGPYSALITGCGTLGAPLRLLTRADRIVGVDRSSKMLAAAKRQAQKSGSKQVELVKCDLVDYPTQINDQFEFIELATMGRYLPFGVQIVDSYLRLLKPRGLLLLMVSVIPPGSLRSRGYPLPFRSLVAGAVSSFIYGITGSTKYRVSASLRAVVGSTERWVATHQGEVSLLFHSVERNGWEHPVRYCALIRKL